MNIEFSKKHKVYIILSAFFIANTILAEIIGVKIFSIEKTLGISDIKYFLLGEEVSLTFTAGVILWPFVFILTDIINDYYGKKGVKFITNISIGILIYTFLMIKLSILLKSPNWWILSNVDKGINDNDIAFEAIFGQGQYIIIGSLTAFYIGQIIDITVFEYIKYNFSKNKGAIWFRATISTLFSQLIDSFIVIIIAFKIGQNWTWSKVLSISINNYLYKTLIAFLLIPLLVFIHRFIKNSLQLNKEEL